jgi:transmembrane sensor
MTALSDDHDKAPRAQAIQWFVTLQSGTVSRAQQEEFADWLCRSPVHIEEYLQLTALQGDLARLPELKSISLDQLLAEASAGPLTEPVIDLHVGSDRRGERPLSIPQPCAGRARSRFRKARAYVGIAAALVAVAIVVAWRSQEGTEHYDTAIAEQRLLSLSDGSRVQLNVQSELSARVTATLRDLSLTEGEALFEVAKDATRPFRVHTPQATIDVMGTQFDVHVRNGQTEVTLLEGNVRIQTAADESTVTLQPGQKLVITAREAMLPTPQQADITVATAWTRHRLVFEDTPLSEVVAEFNRYSRQQLVIRDARLRAKRITASFDAGNTQTFSASLEVAADTHVRRQPDGTWLIEPARPEGR